MKNIKIGILILFLLLLSLVEARVTLKGFPILTLSLLMPLSLSLATELFVPIAFLAGILKDGLFPGNLWISPFFFVLTGLIGYFFRGYVNLKLLTPKLLYFLLFSFFYVIALNWTFRAEITLTNMVSSVVLTSLISLIISWAIG